MTAEMVATNVAFAVTFTVFLVATAVLLVFATRAIIAKGRRDRAEWLAQHHDEPLPPEGA